MPIPNVPVVLADMLVHCAFHRGTMLAATSALMGVSVEKESKVPVMLFAGKELVHLVKVRRAAGLGTCWGLDHGWLQSLRRDGPDTRVGTA